MNVLHERPHFPFYGQAKLKRRINHVPILRALGVQNEVVGIDLVEVNPLTDPTYHSKLVAVRILRELLTGIAMRKKGIKDPMYLDKEWVDRGVPFSSK